MAKTPSKYVFRCSHPRCDNETGTDIDITQSKFQPVCHEYKTHHSNRGYEMVLVEDE